MAIAFRSATTVTSATRTNTTVTAPAGAVNGTDVIAVGINTGNASSVVVTPPGGWTQVSTVQYSAADPWFVNVYLFLRVHDGAGSWVFTHASAASDASAVAWQGVDLTTPSDTTPATNTGVSSGNTASFSSINIVTAGAQQLGLRGSWDGNAITPPASWNERKDTPILWVGDIPAAGTGATGVITVDTGNPSSGPWGTIHAALRPGIVGPPPEETQNSDAMHMMGPSFY